MSQLISTWMELSAEAQAAWVQAIGSIFSLAVAIGIGIFQTRRSEIAARRERERQASIVAAGMATILYSVMTEARIASAAMKKASSLVSESGNPSLLDLDQIRAFTRMKASPTLDVLLASLLVLEAPIGQAILLTTQSARLLDASSDATLYAVRTSTPPKAKETLATLEKDFDKLALQASGALELLRSIHRMELPETGPAS